MRLRNFSILAIVLFSCSQKSDPTPITLLINGNMEAGSTTPNSWFNYKTGDEINTWTKEQSSSPNYSLKMALSRADAQNFSYRDKPIRELLRQGKI